MGGRRVVVATLARIWTAQRFATKWRMRLPLASKTLEAILRLRAAIRRGDKSSRAQPPPEGGVLLSAAVLACSGDRSAAADSPERDWSKPPPTNV